MNNVTQGVGGQKSAKKVSRIIWMAPKHGTREVGQTWLWGELEKIARFKKLGNLSSIYKNGLAFLVRIGIATLSEFSVIYVLTIEMKLI